MQLWLCSHSAASGEGRGAFCSGTLARMASHMISPAMVPIVTLQALYFRSPVSRQRTAYLHPTGWRTAVCRGPSRYGLAPRGAGVPRERASGCVTTRLIVVFLVVTSFCTLIVLRGDPIGLETCWKMAQKFRCLRQVPPRLGAIAAHESTVPVGDRAIGVHDRESCDLGGANLSIRTSLARVGEASKIVSLYGHPPGALCAKRKYTWPQGAQSRTREALVGIDLVEPTTTEVIDYGSRNGGDAVPFPCAKPDPSARWPRP